MNLVMEKELKSISEAYRVFITVRDFTGITCTEVRYLHKVYNYDSDSGIEHETYYDRDGNILEQFVFDCNNDSYIHSQNKLLPRRNNHTFVSDKKGRLIKEKDVDEFGKMNWVTEYGYDTAGRLVSQKTIFQDKCTDIKSIYDEQGNLAEKTYYENDEVQMVIKYRRSNTTLIEYNLDSEGKQRQKWEWTNDQNNLPLQVVEFDKDDKKVRTDKYTYNQSNDITIQQILNSSDILVEKKETEYDLDNRVKKIAISKYIDSSVINETVYDYEYLVI